MARKKQISSRCSGFVDSLATNSGHLWILGDFNIHWDCQRNAQTAYPRMTQRHGHILDLFISRDDEILITGMFVSSMLSDHFLININVSLQK